MILVTGGAGYIGSHVVRLLLARGDSVVVLDDMITGLANRVADVPTVKLDLAESTAGQMLDQIFAEHHIESVLHFAARKQVAQSVERAAWYYHQNVGGLAILLQAMERAAVRRLIFSSSASVYGNPSGEKIAENSPLTPINPYGRSKLVGEWMIGDAANAGLLAATSLRYFNVAGSASPELGDTAILNLIPMVFDRIARGFEPVIFGDDYETFDGTCVRDFIHVSDLADAHLRALDALDEDESRHSIYNVGTGTGASVREVVDLISQRVGKVLTPLIAKRRQGDPARVVADHSRITTDLGWRASYSISDMIDSAWKGWEYYSARVHR
jgi:UDP-glucose 4-epimerase